MPATGHLTACCLAQFFPPGCKDKASIKAYNAPISMSSGGFLLHPHIGTTEGRCGFQRVPVTVENRVVVVGVKNASQDPEQGHQPRRAAEKERL